MTLLSVLRNGDNRFLPLLLAKVNDVLPRLVNPMLQTVPDTPANMCADVDIFDGFGNAGIGQASNFPGYNGNGTSGGSDFKMEPDYERTNISAMPPYDKRIEELGSPINTGDANDSSSYRSPSVIQSPMEYPGIGDFHSFPDLSSSGMASSISSGMSSTNHRGNFGEGVGGGGRNDYKRDFDGMQLGVMGPRQSSIDSLGGRRPPIRQGSGSSYGMQIPRSIPEQYPSIQRTNGGDLPFR